MENKLCRTGKEKDLLSLPPRDRYFKFIIFYRLIFNIFYFLLFYFSSLFILSLCSLLPFWLILLYFVTVMVARIHLTNMPLVEDGKSYRRIFGVYGLGVAAIPILNHTLCVFVILTQEQIGFFHIRPRAWSRDISDLQITMRLTSSTSQSLKWASSLLEWHL